MTLEQSAYLAEIIGVIIVVVTLVYLSVQVRCANVDVDLYARLIHLR